MNTFFTKHGITRSFTLIETMVAIAIIALTLVAPFEAIEDSLTASDTSRDELIGSMLNQEAIEEVIQMRDNNYLADYTTPGSVTWLYGMDGSASSPNCFTNKCVIDATPLATNHVAICPGGVCPVLYVSTPTSAPTEPYFYNEIGNGNATSFTRSIQMTSISATEAKIVSTTNWITHNRPGTSVITEYIDNWQPSS